MSIKTTRQFEGTSSVLFPYDAQVKFEPKQGFCPDEAGFFARSVNMALEDLIRKLFHMPVTNETA